MNLMSLDWLVGIGLMAATAVLTGKKRDPEALRSTWDTLRDLHSAGLIDRIIVSSWTTQRSDMMAELRPFCPTTLVFSPEPTVFGLVGHPLHQARAWAAALRYVRDDDVILKVRTDRCSRTILHGLGERLRRGLRETDLVGGYPAVFQRRPCVPYFNPNYPFMFHDIEFGALAVDMKLLCNYDLKYIFDMRAPSPEGFFYAPPFARVFWEVRALLQIGLFEFFGEGLAAWYAAIRDHPFWEWLWLFHMQLAHRYFEIGWDGLLRDGAEKFERLGARRGLYTLCLEGEPSFAIYKHSMLAGAVCASTEYLNHLNHLCTEDAAGNRQLAMWQSMRSRTINTPPADCLAQIASLRAILKALPEVREEPLFATFMPAEEEVVEI